MFILDSAYIALSAPSLDDVIKPEKRALYEYGLYGMCLEDDVGLGDNQVRWFPRRCCDRHELYDKRTPGLLKLEFEGDLFIGLASKTYLVQNEAGKTKFSSKGLNKRLIENPLAMFQTVMETEEPVSGFNVGFRAKDNTVFTYQQEKLGLPFLYVKREVLADNVTTVPLDIILDPFAE